MTNEYSLSILLLDLISTMEQVLSIAQAITTISGAIVSIIGLVVSVYVIMLCVKFDRLMKQVNATAQSVQQLSMLPLTALTTVLRKFL